MIPGVKNYFDDTLCNAWESCALFENGDVTMNKYVCISSKHCGEEGRFQANLGSIGRFKCSGERE
jgi:uncharacterized protein YkwD